MSRKNLIFRKALRIVCAVLLLLFSIFRVAIPYIKNQPLYLDKNDLYVIIGCLVVLLSINPLKRAIDTYLTKKSNQ